MITFLDIECTKLAIVAAVIVLLLTVYFLSGRNSNLPPGPKGIPYIGIYLSLSDDPHLDFAKLAEKYGDIFSFSLFGRTYIHLNSIDVIKEAFFTRGDVFSGRETAFSLLNWIDEGQGLAQTEGHVWKDDRRFFLHNVKSFGFGKLELEPHIHDVTNHLLEVLRDTKQQPSSAIPVISLATINIAGKVFTGHQYTGLQDPDFLLLTENAFDVLKEFLGPRMLVAGPIYKYLIFRLSPAYKKLTKSKDVLYEIADKIMEEHQKAYDKNYIRDFTDRFIEEMYTQLQRGGHNLNIFTEDKLRAIIINIFLDGMLSVTLTLNGFLQFLALNQDVQRQVQKEIDTIVGYQRLPSWADRNNLPYTDAAILEFHRLISPFPLAAIHKCTENVTFHGYEFPKNTLVMGNIWSVHNNPVLFPNPSKCDPSRFLSSDGRRARRESIVSFGVGKRACVGEALANMEMFVIMTSIVQKFNLKLPLGANEDDLRKKDTFDIRFVPRADLH